MVDGASKTSWRPSKSQHGESLVMVISVLYTHRGENLNALNYSIQVSCPYITRCAHTKDDKRADTSACYRRGVTHNSHTLD